MNAVEDLGNAVSRIPLWLHFVHFKKAYISYRYVQISHRSCILRHCHPHSVADRLSAIPAFSLRWIKTFLRHVSIETAFLSLSNNQSVSAHRISQSNFSHLQRAFIKSFKTSVYVNSEVPQYAISNRSDRYSPCCQNSKLIEEFVHYWTPNSCSRWGLSSSQ